MRAGGPAPCAHHQHPPAQRAPTHPLGSSAAPPPPLPPPRAGVPNSGKSEWLDAVCVNLAEQHGWSFAYCSLEKRPEWV